MIIAMQVKTMFHRLPKILNAAFLAGATLVLAACDGGIVGSGNGGGNPIPPNPIVPPDIGGPTIQMRYVLHHVPDQLLVDLPAALLASSDLDYSDQPYTLNATQLRKITLQQIELGLMRLNADANWDKLIEYCLTTPQDTACDLDDSSIETPYTYSMALWEIDQRSRFEKLLTGTNTVPADRLTEITELATARVGSTLSLTGGTFIESFDSEYRYEISFLVDATDGERFTTLKWSDDESKIQSKYLNTTPTEQSALTINHFKTESTSEAFGTVLYSENTTTRSTAFQLNYRQSPDDQNLYLQSGLALMNKSTRLDILSRGYANSTGGYLSSDVTTGESSQYKRKERRREVFTPARELDAAERCSDTAEGCTQTEDWELLIGNTLEDSDFFRSDSSIREILDKKSVVIDGVTDEPDALVLINRTKIEFPQVAYAVPPSNPLKPTTQNVAHVGLGLSSTTGYAGEQLCRITPTDTADGTIYRAYCAGTDDQLRDAVVISEQYDFGQLSTKHLPSVTITVK